VNSVALRKKDGAESLQRQRMRQMRRLVFLSKGERHGDLKLRVLPELGARRLADVHRGDLQAFVRRMVGEGLAASTIHNSIMPLRAIFRLEIAEGRLAVNPTTGLQLPAVRPTRDRVADPEEAVRLVAALPVTERALWATALYAGLRRRELQGLK
jgi:integrase